MTKRIDLDNWVPSDPSNPLKSLAHEVEAQLDIIEESIAAVSGKVGATGPQGPIGLTGAKGDTGAQGIPGPAGIPSAMNQKQYIPPNTVTINGVGQTILSTTFTTNGNPVMLVANGDANPLNGQSWCRLQWFRNGTAIGKPIQLESGQANVNVTYAVLATDTPPAGTHTYSLQTTMFGPNVFQFGETDPPVANFIELAGSVGPQGPAGVGIKGIATGYVNAGTFVTLDNIKATVTTTGNRGLSVASVSGTFTATISATFSLTGGSGGHSTAWPGATVTTTPSGSWFAYHFPNAGDGSTYLVNDYNNAKFYRINLMIGPGYNNNFISIERLA